MSFLDHIVEAIDAERSSKIYGVVSAIVTNIQDPDKLGRVKVKFPWLSDSNESYWARIATFMAGPSRGAFFLPEVNDEVLVAFEHGDINTPYIIGALWNGQDKPPQDNSDGNNHIKEIKSRSGHTLIFNDEDNKEKITLKSKVGHTLELDDKDGQGLTTLKTNGGHTLIMDDAGKKLTLKDSSGNFFEIDSNSGAIQIKGSGEVKVSGQGGIVLDSQEIKLGTSASTTLVNDTFIDLFNAHMHTGNSGAPTTPPLVPAIKNVNSTMITKGS